MSFMFPITALETVMAVGGGGSRPCPTVRIPSLYTLVSTSNRVNNRKDFRVEINI